MYGESLNNAIESVNKINAQNLFQNAPYNKDGLLWHLRAFALQVPDVRAYEDCRSWDRHVLLSCSNFAHKRNTYVHGLASYPGLQIAGGRTGIHCLRMRLI